MEVDLDGAKSAMQGNSSHGGRIGGRSRVVRPALNTLYSCTCPSSEKSSSSCTERAEQVLAAGVRGQGGPVGASGRRVSGG